MLLNELHANLFLLRKREENSKLRQREAEAVLQKKSFQPLASLAMASKGGRRSGPTRP